MTSLLRWSLTGAAAICVLIALKSVLVAYRTSPYRRHLVLALAAICAAGYEYAALGVYRSDTIEAYVAAIRIHIALAALTYLALVWVAALDRDRVPRWLRWSASVLTAGVVIWSLLSPYTLIFIDVLDLQGVLLPWGEIIVQATTIPSAWSHVVELLTFTLYGVCAHAWLAPREEGGSGTSLPIALGMAILLATMVVEAADPRVVPMLPADELGLLVLLLALSFSSR